MQENFNNEINNGSNNPQNFNVNMNDQNNYNNLQNNNNYNNPQNNNDFYNYNPQMNNGMYNNMGYYVPVNKADMNPMPIITILFSFFTSSFVLWFSIILDIITIVTSLCLFKEKKQKNYRVTLIVGIITLVIKFNLLFLIAMVGKLDIISLIYTMPYYG